MPLFSKSLARLRVEAGFQNPYAFYHRNGGRRVFPFTFAYYLKLERGEHLPRPEWLPVLLSLLRIPPTDALYRRFVTDYLKDHFQTEENFQSLLAPLLRPETVNHAQQTTKRLLSEQVYHLTPAQYMAVVKDAGTYWAFECLVNDRQAFGVDELASITGLPKAALKKGLDVLVAQKLAKRASKGRFKSPLAGKFYQFPRAFPGIEAHRKRLERHISEMVARKGSLTHASGVMIRAESGSVHRCVAALRDALEASTAYSVYDKAENSGVYLLEIRARKALDF